MFFKILENEQVMKQEFGDTFTQWIPVGMEKEVHVTITETTVCYQWVKFDLIQEQYITDTTNVTHIIIDADGVLNGPNNPQEHTPVDGKVEYFITHLDKNVQ